jgi:hypothetical protein
MSAVSILASALQDDAGTGAALDVSAFSTLRLNWSVSADIGRMNNMGHLRLFIDTAPSAGGPWHVAYERQLDANGWDPKPRTVLSGFDSFVRARWSGYFPRTTEMERGRPQYNEAATKFFTIGLTGDGQPDAS